MTQHQPDCGRLVPEDFDLDAALQAGSSTPRDDQDQCPYCASVNVTRKTMKADGDPVRLPGRYRCNECREHFDRPGNSGGR